MKTKLGRIAISVAAVAVLAAAFLLVFPGCSRGGRPTRVLFIGNSYTYFNNLPEIFAGLARESGREVETRMEAPGGWRLKDHWEKGEARKALGEGHWDFVVLQDQSTLGVNYYFEGKPRVTSDEVFRPYAEKWTSAIREAGAKPVFYLTWARKATPEDQAALNYAYVSAAREGRAIVAPVGVAWGLEREREPAVELYYRDGSHPSAAGSYLAACTLYAAIFKHDPAGLPGRVEGRPVNLDTEKVEAGKTAVLVDLPPSEARALQSAAWDAYRQFAAKGGYIDVAPEAAPEAVVPEGAPLSQAALEGGWTGEILFYPAGPVEMTLVLRRQAAAWSGRLQITYHSKDFADESIELADLSVGERGLTFSVPKSVGVDNLKISFRGACPRPDEMAGTAETVRVGPDSTVRLLGTWLLRKKVS